MNKHTIITLLLVVAVVALSVYDWRLSERIAHLEKAAPPIGFGPAGPENGGGQSGLPAELDGVHRSGGEASTQHSGSRVFLDAVPVLLNGGEQNISAKAVPAKPNAVGTAAAAVPTAPPPITSGPPDVLVAGEEKQATSIKQGRYRSEFGNMPYLFEGKLDKSAKKASDEPVAVAADEVETSAAMPTSAKGAATPAHPASPWSKWKAIEK